MPEAQTTDPLAEQTHQGLFLTSAAFPVEELESLRSTVVLTLDGSDPDAVEHVRNHIGVDSAGTTCAPWGR